MTPEANPPGFAPHDAVPFAAEETPGAEPEPEPWKMLIVDDEDEVHRVTKLALARVTFEQKRLQFLSAYSGAEALHLLQRHPDTALILLDVVMETGMAGFAVVYQIREDLHNALVRIILRTGHPGQAPEDRVILDYDINDYKTKTELTTPKLLTTVITALRTFRHLTTLDRIAADNARLYQQVQQAEALLKEKVATLHRELAHQQRPVDLIGTGPAMAQVFTLLDSATASTLTVLLEGETGTGKERLAKAIHYQGPRQTRAFVAVNCSALPDPLLESELFGHTKGAFSGATQDKPGLFEVADGGTLFLDEISEASAALQAKLLRVLQEGELRRLGATQVRHVDVRVIAATNRDLLQEVQQQRFRADLYYRLSIFPITVPPLRARREDLPLLVTHFLRRSATKLTKAVAEVSPETLEVLGQYGWPGNVRELENVIERAVALAPPGGSVTPDLLPPRLTASQSLGGPLLGVTGSLQQAKDAFERAYVSQVLQQHQGNATQTARTLGLSRQMLQRKIKQYGLRLPTDSAERLPAVDGP